MAEAEAVLGISGGEAIPSEQEHELGQIMEERGFELLAAHPGPLGEQPFYHMREGAELTRSFEMIYRGVEITSGSVCEHRYRDGHGKQSGATNLAVLLFGPGAMMGSEAMDWGGQWPQGETRKACKRKHSECPTKTV